MLELFYEEIVGAGHALVSVLISLDDRTVVEEALQQSRHGADESCATFSPGWVF
jgi:hypothetical protein